MNKPRFSEETILSVSKTTLENARTYQADLASFGVTTQLLDEFESNIQAAEALPDETANRINLRGITQEKDSALEACTEWGRRLRTRLEMAFGNKSPQVSLFPSKELSAAADSESQMMPVMEILIDLATRHQTELAAVGQTPEISPKAVPCWRNCARPTRPRNCGKIPSSPPPRSATSNSRFFTTP